MKVRIKVTGEVVEIVPKGQMHISTAAYETEDGRRLPSTALEFEKEIDWEQRRYEIAKDLVAAMYIDDGQAQRANEAAGGIHFEYRVGKHMAKEAVQIADALIVELKKGGRQ